ncbi:chitinase [Brucella intermedia]|nr:chitinase [Brucella intermedia]
MYTCKIAAISAVSYLALTLGSQAFPNYDPNANYPTGAKVTLHGVDYEAKWWANPGQSPEMRVENEWNTPWRKLSTSPHESKPTPSEPINKNKKEEPHSVQTDVQWVLGSRYNGGDIVMHHGKRYVCVNDVVSKWCSSNSRMYEPGIGSAWTQAWRSQDGTNLDEAVRFRISERELGAQESALTDTPLLNSVKKTIATRNNEVVEAISPGRQENPSNVKLVERILNSEGWDYIFPKRANAYTYENFLKAIGKFPAICEETNKESAEGICRKTLATMFAHFTQETGAHEPNGDVEDWRQGLHWVREMGWKEGQKGGYNSECSPSTWQGQAWPCGKDADGDYLSYFGRGAKQLSYNYNYGQFSQAMFGDVSVLLERPDLVADTWLNLASAIFFYVYPQPPKPSMQSVINGTWQPNATDIADGLVPGFGVTTQIINGGVECGGAVEVAQSENRINYYRNFAAYLKVAVPDGEILGCKGMKQFSEAGAGAVNIFWEQDYNHNANHPDGKSYACKLVGYQTPFSAFTVGDYSKCVKQHFPDIEITR